MSLTDEDDAATTKADRITTLAAQYLRARSARDAALGAMPMLKADDPVPDAQQWAEMREAAAQWSMVTLSLHLEMLTLNVSSAETEAMIEKISDPSGPLGNLLRSPGQE